MIKRSPHQEIADLRGSITNLIRTCEHLLGAMQNLEERVDELERLAGLHGTIVLPPETHLPPELLQRAIEKMD